MIEVAEHCLLCALCLENCPEKALVFIGKSVKLKGACRECGACLEICPVAAISFQGADKQILANKLK